MRKEEIVQVLGAMERRLDQENAELKCVPVTRYASRVVRRRQHGRNIAVWSDAIEAALAETGGVWFPASDEAYYIDRPIILSGGMRMQADKGAIIRCVDGMRTCMVRNRNLKGVRHGDTPCASPQRDTGISISGGVWDHAKTQRNHTLCAADEKDSVPYAWGLFLFANVSDLSIRDLRVMRSPAYAIYVGNGDNLLVKDICFEECLTDGVHVDGPFSNVVVKRLRGVTGDDFVAVTSWWGEMSAGDIDRVWIRDLTMEGGHRGMRLLTADNLTGFTLSDVVVENVSGTRDFKMYPCCLKDGEAVKYSGLGSMNWIYLENVDFLDSYVFEGYPPKGAGYNGYVDVNVNSRHVSFKNIRGPLPHVKVGPRLEHFRRDGNLSWESDCMTGSTIDEIVFEGVPQEDEGSVLEVRRDSAGNSASIGKVVFQ
jgi:polygalacturonase